MTEPIITTAEQPAYQDDDLVYVDPDARAVLGLVQFDEKGMPKKLARPPREGAHVEEDDEPAAAGAPVAAAIAPIPAPAPAAAPLRGRGRDRRPLVRKPRVRYYPWGTYRSMKKIFKVAGKVPETRGQATLDEILPKALNEAFWDNKVPSIPSVTDASGDQY